MKVTTSLSAEHYNSQWKPNITFLKPYPIKGNRLSSAATFVVRNQLDYNIFLNNDLYLGLRSYHIALVIHLE